MELRNKVLTVWRTPAERCDIMWGSFRGYRVRVWLEDQLTQDELRWDIHGAINRAMELQLERPLETIIQ